jgi:predicted metal-dependent phosphoesterase TrpH
MTRLIAALLLVIATGAGTYADRPQRHGVRRVGGYRVLAADFHLHSSTWSDGALTPFGIVLEAERRGLDAIAITGHDELLDARAARRFSKWIGGPTVIVGEEIQSEPHYHLIALGIHEKVSWRLSAADAIDAIHRQGGVAIAAHPAEAYWAGWGADAMRRLDGTEVCHPLVYVREGARDEFERFAARTNAAAIGSSDFHGSMAMGACRTFVFAASDDASAILDAIRARRTVVFGRDGRAYGDPALIPLAERAGLREESDEWRSRGGALDSISRVAGVVGLALLLYAAYGASSLRET